LKKAKYELEFEAEAHLVIDKEMDVALPDGSQIVFDKSDDVNRGKIVLEIAKPDMKIARDQGRRRVEQFFNCMLIGNDRLEDMKQIMYLQPKLLNLQDFRRARYYAELPIILIPQHKLEQQTLQTTSDLITKILRLPEEKKDIMSRSLRWFRKASEAEGEDRFIFRWISFEVLLGFLKKRKATQNLIPEFVHRFYDTETAERILQKHKKTVQILSHAKLESLRGVKVSEELRNSLKKDRDSKRILQCVTRCIFEVRNNLFHEGTVPKLMGTSSSLLRDIIRECLKFSEFNLEN